MRFVAVAFKKAGAGGDTCADSVPALSELVDSLLAAFLE